MFSIPKKNLSLLTGKQFGNIPHKLIVLELHYATLVVTLHHSANWSPCRNVVRIPSKVNIIIATLIIAFDSIFDILLIIVSGQQLK